MPFCNVWDRCYIYMRWLYNLLAVIGLNSSCWFFVCLLVFWSFIYIIYNISYKYIYLYFCIYWCLECNFFFYGWKPIFWSLFELVDVDVYCKAFVEFLLFSVIIVFSCWLFFSFFFKDCWDWVNCLANFSKFCNKL